MMGKIITAGVFVILASTFAFTQEPGPSVAPSPPPVLAQSPRAGVIEAAATPAPTPVATPASASAAPTVGQAPATASPSVEASPAAANASPVAAPTPASTFSSQLLGGKEPELDPQERAGVEITAAWRQRSYQSMVSQALQQVSNAHQQGSRLVGEYSNAIQYGQRRSLSRGSESSIRTDRRWTLRRCLARTSRGKPGSTTGGQSFLEHI